MDAPRTAHPPSRLQSTRVKQWLLSRRVKAGQGKTYQWPSVAGSRCGRQVGMSAPMVRCLGHLRGSSATLDRSVSTFDTVEILRCRSVRQLTVGDWIPLIEGLVTILAGCFWTRGLLKTWMRRQRKPELYGKNAPVRFRDGMLPLRRG